MRPRVNLKENIIIVQSTSDIILKCKIKILKMFKEMKEELKETRDHKNEKEPKNF